MAADTTIQEATRAAFEDRTDPKWAHPVMRDQYYWDGTGFDELMWAMLDPDKSTEEVINLRNQINELFKSSGMTLTPAQQQIADQGTWAYHDAPGLSDGDPTIRLRVWTPKAPAKSPTPTVFYIFGGGFTGGTPEMSEGSMMEMNPGADYTIVAPVFRLAPEWKYPAAIDDLEAAYRWVLGNASELGIDPDLVVLAGESSGGHMTAALSHRLKKHGMRARAQILLLPVIDDREMTLSSRLNCCMWTRELERASLQAWLGAKYADSAVGPDAMPGHALPEDFIGLPPTYIHVMEHDHSRDDVLRYAQGLLDAGVFCELKLWAGQNHISISILPSEIKERWDRDVREQLGDAIKYDLSRPWTE